MGLFAKKKVAGADLSKLPRHIAIIMDGNGRWAEKRALPRTAGHAAGAETFRRVATYCRDIGLQYLTVYAFSTENWRRPLEEIDTIWTLLEKYLHEAIERMERDRVRMRFFGDTSALSPQLQTLIAETAAISDRLTGCQVNVCVNYGGRDEILRAAMACREEKAPITEELFSQKLWSAGVPDPDLVIRPGGEYRISNFLLWQAAYAEFYFTETLWPDFDEQEILRAIAAYQRRERRFGGLR